MSETKLMNGGIAVDDRGSVRFVNDFNFENVKRFFYAGFVGYFARNGDM